MRLGRLAGLRRIRFLLAGRPATAVGVALLTLMRGKVVGQRVFCKRFAQEGFYLAEAAAVAARHKSYGRAFGIGAGGAAYAVDIVFGIVRLGRASCRERV